MNIYTVTIPDAQSITNANGDYVILECTCADDVPITVLGWELDVLSELGEAQEENLRIKIGRGYATTGNGTATTARPLDPATAAAVGTYEVAGSTPTSAGTEILLGTLGLSVRPGTGSQMGPLPDGFGFKTNQTAGLLSIILTTAVTDDLTLSGFFWVGEG